VFFTAETPAGPLPQVRTPLLPRDAQPAPPPTQGQHTADILAEAGFSADEIAELLRSGAAR
jgi:crotonobetainyl-CoA:carnitine CoA-transferase CaiB-like acyl-CoA transferase